jgi:hypothetical protein
MPTGKFRKKRLVHCAEAEKFYRDLAVAGPQGACGCGGRRGRTLARTTAGEVAVLSCGFCDAAEIQSREDANRPTAASKSPHRKCLGGTRCGLTQLHRAAQLRYATKPVPPPGGCVSQELLLTITVFSPTLDSHEQASEGWIHP